MSAGALALQTHRLFSHLEFPARRGSPRSYHAPGATPKLRESDRRAAPSTLKLVLTELYKCCDSNGHNAWPTLKTLAARCQLSERWTAFCVRALARLGLVKARRRRGTSSVYQVVVPNPQPALPFEEGLPSRGDRISDPLRSGSPILRTDGETLEQPVVAAAVGDSPVAPTSPSYLPQDQRKEARHARRWWGTRQPKLRAAPEVLHHNAADDWYEECGRLHNHECELSRWRHFERKATDAFRLQYQRGETSAGLAACPG